jgi:YD repeat-containing protein
MNGRLSILSPSSTILIDCRRCIAWRLLRRAVSDFCRITRTWHGEGPADEPARAPLKDDHYYYDGLGRIIQSRTEMPPTATQQNWSATITAYDASGRVASISAPEYKTDGDYAPFNPDSDTTYAYDVFGRATGVTAPDGTKSTTDYTGTRKQVMKVTDTSTRTRSTEEYDGRGRLVKVTEPSGATSSTSTTGSDTTTAYAYDYAVHPVRTGTRMAALTKTCRWVFALTFSLTGCASITSETVFSRALRSLCELPELRAPAVMEVIDTTAPNVVQLAALRMAMNNQTLSSDEVASLTSAEETLTRNFVSERVSAPKTACTWKVTKDPQKYSEMLRVELSSIFPAGMASNATLGIFARVSLGGRPGADYYWLPLADGEGSVGRPVRLDVDDG